MKSKIRWYREVLELEPHSKVFFPLARLLVENEQFDEALATLRQGLGRHPEFVEAKLLLAEVLQRLDREQDLDDLVQDVSGSMVDYPAFWDAWARLLDADEHGRDPAMAMRFLAAWFAGRKLSWSQIMEAGLLALLGEEQELPPIPEALREAARITSQEHGDMGPGPLSGRAGGESAGKEGVSSSLLDLDDEEDEDDIGAEDAGDAHLAMQAAEEAEDVEAVGGEEDAEEAEHAEIAEDDGQGGSEASPAPPGEEDSGPVAASSLRSFEAALAETELYPVEDEATEPDSGQEPAEEQAEPAVSEESVEPEEDEGDEETFSLRTRTMADLLAEQGDYEGALDIYRELAAVTPAGEVRQELETLADEMRGRMGTALDSAGKRSTKKTGKPQTSRSTGLKGKKKLISALESLAQRLEAKAAN